MACVFLCRGVRECTCVCCGGAGDWLATAGERRENTAAGRGEENRREERRGEEETQGR